MADDQARLGGGTAPYEAFLERKRQALRKALRTEFIRQRYSPNFLPDGTGHLFDAAIQRWQAMQATQGEFFYPTIKNGLHAAAITLLPMSILIGLAFYTKNSFEDKCRKGLMAYDADERRGKWFLS